ncbi:MAG: hypothetical protein RIQ79_1503 [Verrucomicrobiota bacterium]
MKTKVFRLLFTSLAAISVSTLHANPYELSPVSANAEASVLTFDQDALLSPSEVCDFAGPETAASEPSASVKGSGEASGSAADSVKSFGVEAGAGSFSAGGVDGKLYTIRIPYSKKLNERATLLFTVPISLTNFDNNKLVGLKFKDTQAYGVGLNVGYAWQAFLKRHNVPYRWKITPSTGIYYRDSNDLNNGSLVFNAGLSSSFAWQFQPGWVINLGNSVSMAWNNGISNYPDPVLDEQQTVSNGLQLIHMTGRWTYYTYYSHTDTLVDTLVDSYYTIAVGAGYQLTRKRSIKATLLSERGNGGYEALRGTLGTSWQF